MCVCVLCVVDSIPYYSCGGDHIDSRWPHHHNGDGGNGYLLLLLLQETKEITRRYKAISGSYTV